VVPSLQRHRGRQRDSDRPYVGLRPQLSKLARNKRNWTGQVLDSTCPSVRAEKQVGSPHPMLSKLRFSRRGAVSGAEQGGTTLRRCFRGTFPGVLAEVLAFCCPNWLWEKPNLDKSGLRHVPPQQRRPLVKTAPAADLPLFDHRLRDRFRRSVECE
jgi:hypothetical protein